MKKTLIIILAFISAFTVNELIIKFVICYPVYGLDKQVAGIRSSQGGWQNLYLPYSKYWNVEGGNIIESFNNRGLPGEDIILTDSVKVIFLLGDSFMECLQMPKKDMAVSVFQRELNNLNKNFSVINLSYSGHDPYDLYFRTKYFSRIIKPDYIILVLQEDKTEWLKRHKNIDFVIKPDAGKENDSKTYLLQKYSRNTFSFINLLISARKSNKPADIKPENNDDDRTKITNNNYFSLLNKVLLKYKEEYGNNFIILSASNDTNLNTNLNELCLKYQINYFQKDIFIPENKISKIGHLNKSGNIKLGEFLYNSMKIIFTNK